MQRHSAAQRRLEEISAVIATAAPRAGGYGGLHDDGTKRVGILGGWRLRWGRRWRRRRKARHCPVSDGRRCTGYGSAEEWRQASCQFGPPRWAARVFDGSVFVAAIGMTLPPDKNGWSPIRQVHTRGRKLILRHALTELSVRVRQATDMYARAYGLRQGGGGGNIIPATVAAGVDGDDVAVACGTGGGGPATTVGVEHGGSGGSARYDGRILSGLVAATHG
jgi:hypothetical protein